MAAPAFSQVPGVGPNAAGQVQDAQSADQSPWAASVMVSHAVGTGTFVSNEYVRQQSDSISQSWNIFGTRRWKLADHVLWLSAGWGFGLEFSTPKSLPTRRFDPNDVSVALTDFSVWTIPVLDVVINGSMQAFLPTSYRSRFVTKRWLGLRAVGGLARSFGPVMLNYALTVGKDFNASKTRVVSADLARQSDPIRSGDSNGVQLDQGPANVSWLLSNRLTVQVMLSPLFSVGYVWSLIHQYKYDLFDEDALQSVQASADRPRALDMTSYSISATIDLDGALSPLWDVPFDLYANAGMAALHPARSEDNGTIMWPVFVQSLGSRAANNYVRYFINVGGTYE